MSIITCRITVYITVSMLRSSLDPALLLWEIFSFLRSSTTCFRAVRLPCRLHIDQAV
jgi:hypothetical protein